MMPTVSNLALSLIALGVLVALFMWQRSHPNFDLSDLITGDNGKVSATKFAQTGAWVVATWGFVTLIQQGKMTEWYFGAYMAASFGVRVAKDALSKPAP
jgi:ABC-type Mn2+/Zn2+ transport system permease subunit